MVFAMMPWITGVGAAISMKVTSSIDDIVWLAPFLTSNQSRVAKARNALIYISVCLVQTVFAMIIAYSGDTLVKKLTEGREGVWSSEKILTVAAGSMLSVYSVKLFHEYFTEGDEDDSEKSSDGKTEEEQSVALTAVIEEGGGSPTSPEDAALALKDAAEAARSHTLFVIAFLGSLDDLTLFVPMLVGRGFGLAQLVIGGLTAASGIVLLCVFIGLCKPVADCLSKIPLGAIVITFATILLTKAWFME